MTPLARQQSKPRAERTARLRLLGLGPACVVARPLGPVARPLDRPPRAPWRRASQVTALILKVAGRGDRGLKQGEEGPDLLRWVPNRPPTALAGSSLDPAGPRHSCSLYARAGPACKDPPAARSEASQRASCFFATSDIVRSFGRSAGGAEINTAPTARPGRWNRPALGIFGLAKMWTLLTLFFNA